MTEVRSLLAWPVLLAELLIFGTGAFALTLGPCEGRRDGLVASLVPLWRISAIVDLIVSPFLLTAIGSGMAGVGWASTWTLMPQILGETHAGHVWSCRLCVVALLVAFAFWPMGLRRRAWLITIIALALLFMKSLTSHAIDRGATAIAIYFIHECAAALWLGAVLCLWWGVRIGRADDDAWADSVSPWVSRLAGWTVLVLVLSGSFTAYQSLAQEPGRIFYTAYGRILLIKVGAAAVILMIGAYNRFILMAQVRGPGARRSLVRNVGLESILLAGVVYIAALLANTPPAH